MVLHNKHNGLETQYLQALQGTVTMLSTLCWGDGMHPCLMYKHLFTAFFKKRYCNLNLLLVQM